MEKVIDATCGVILAAGNSSRMGQPKAILPLKGKPFIAHVVAAMRAAGIRDITAVLGRHQEAVKTAWRDEAVKVVVNGQPEMGHSPRSTYRLHRLAMMFGGWF